MLEGDGTICVLFGGFAEQFGFDRDELVGRKIHDFIACEEIVEFVDANMDCSANAARNLKLICDCKQKNGQWITLDICLQTEDVTFSHKSKKISCSIALAGESTDKVEDATKHDERVSFALQNASQAVWDCNLNSNEVWYSSQWYTMRGFKIGDTSKQGHAAWQKRLHPDDREPILEKVEHQDQGLEPENAFEYREKHADGHWMWIMSRGRVVEWNDDGTPARIIGTDTDITTMKEREAREQNDSRQFFEESMKSIIAAHKRARSERREAMALANQDPLTGLANRRLLLQELDKMLQMPLSDGTVRMMFFFDLDRFKPINDEHGHAAGDYVLKRLADRLPYVLRENDIVTRVGGDEFAVVIERKNQRNSSTDEIALRIARRLKEAVEEPVYFNGRELQVGASVGVSIFHNCSETAEMIIHDADLAMYEAKQCGETRISRKLQTAFQQTGTSI